MSWIIARIRRHKVFISVAPNCVFDECGLDVVAGTSLWYDTAFENGSVGWHVWFFVSLSMPEGISFWYSYTETSPSRKMRGPLSIHINQPLP